MTKAKKIIIGTLAAGIVAATTCIAASASTNSGTPAKSTYNEDVGVIFRWGQGYSEVINMGNTRLASASVTVRDGATNAVVATDYDTNVISSYDSVIASASGTYPISLYYSECSGLIYASGSHYAPVEWEPKVKYTG